MGGRSRIKNASPIRHAVALSTERLESRLLFDVTAASLEATLFTKGKKWTYLETSSFNPGSFSDLIVTTKGQTTVQADADQPGWEADYYRTGGIDGSAGWNEAGNTFYGLDNSGDFVTYQKNVQPIEFGTVEVFPTPLISLPATVVNRAYQFSSDYDAVSYEQVVGFNKPITGSGYPGTLTQVVTLVSDTPISLSVPAGTYDVYEVTTVATDTNSSLSSVSTTTEYISPQYGLIKYIKQESASAPIFTGVLIPGESIAFEPHVENAFVNSNIEFEGPITFDSVSEVDVDVLNASGDVDGSASGSVTISTGVDPNGNGGSPEFTGTLTEPIVGGVAKFKDLKGLHPGVVSLQATADDGLTATSNTFDEIGKLSFASVPQEFLFGKTISPSIKVDYEDGNGKLLQDAGTVDLALETAKGNATYQTYTATLNGGVASFDDVNISGAGQYTLVAYNSEVGTVAASSAISIMPPSYHLAFVAQIPKTASDAALTYKIALENSKNRVLTSDDTFTVALSLNAMNGTKTAGLSSVTDTLIRGVASNKTGSVSISSPGIYTLNASLYDAAAGNPPTPLSELTLDATSSQFTVVADHIAFKRQPAKTLVDAPIRFSVALLDYKNHLVVSSDQLEIYLVTTADSSSAGSSPRTAQLQSGSFTSLPAYPFSIDTPGSYQIRVDAVPGNVADPVPIQGLSKLFKVVAPHSK